MKKEAVIVIITIVLIFIGNFILEKYSSWAISTTTDKLEQLKNLISQENIEPKEAKDMINKIHEYWDEKYRTMSFFIEHNELEKVETELTGLRASIEEEEYSEALNELARAEYILKHIGEKNKLSWKNLF